MADGQGIPRGFSTHGGLLIGDENSYHFYPLSLLSMLLIMRRYNTILLIFVALSCRDKGVEPDNIQPGRRDYTFTIDTLRTQPGDLFYPTNIWGSLPNDVWVVGHADASDLSKWHFDGTKWTRDSSRFSSNLQSIFGFSPNNVWACDAPGGNMWHYNGSVWSKYGNYTPSGYLLLLNNIWGDAPNNIYAVGGADSTEGGAYKGIIMHYNGINWRFVTIPKIRVGFSWIRRGIKESNKYYLSSTTFEATGDTEKIYQFDGISLKEIYRTTTEVATVNEVNERIYFAIGKKVMKYKGDQLQVWKDFTGTTFLGRLWGRSEKDFFSVASDGIAHFNGTDLKTIYPTDIIIFDMAIFSSEIFVLGVTRQNSHPVAIHGILQ